MQQREHILNYIDEYWPRLIRENKQDNGTLIGLPHPYFVPSDGSMFQEFYYWDSYFIALGLLHTVHEHYVIDITENMAYLINRFGFMPNASRYYFTSHSQPPFFTQQMWLSFAVKQKRGDADSSDYLNRMTQTAIKEYTTAWSGEKPPHHRQVFQGLSRYFDINYLNFLASCESGWDHSTRCDDQWLDFLPIDLNAILYVNELDIARALNFLGNDQQAGLWYEKAEKRKQTIQNLMWDANQGFFFDYNWKTQQLDNHPSLAGFYPLWAGLATGDQAKQLVEKWLPQFLYPGGLVTTLEQKAERQWAFPNGWAPLQWIVDAGLERYGYAPAALDVRQKWCQNCEMVFGQTQALWEKYNVVHIGENVEPGVYGQVKGFGWSNAVYVDFNRRIPGQYRA